MSKDFSLQSEWEAAAARAYTLECERDAALAQLRIVSQSFEAVCEALECARDDEAALSAIERLKGGASRRDQFAQAALQGLLAAGSADIFGWIPDKGVRKRLDAVGATIAAEAAFLIADAMVKARGE